jgi:pathogenesis-related protein 1
MNYSSRILSIILLTATLAGAQDGPNGSTIPKAGPHVEIAVARKKLRDDMPKQIAEFMKLHNDARAEVGVPPLEWDDGLAAYAQEWAETIAARDEMEHRPNGKYGENLAGYLPQYGERPVHGAKMWYDEIKEYHGEKIDGQNFQQFGHYTQMVWRKTTRVGFGMAMTPKGMVMLCANYAEAGNMMGEHPYQIKGQPAVAVKPKTDKWGNIIPDGPPPPGLEKPIDMPVDGNAVAPADAGATQTFIQTLNDLRQKRGLPAQRLDPQIVQSAQWLAEHMARHDSMGHDAMLIGGPKFASMRGINDRLQNFGFAANGAAEACAEGEWADVQTATKNFTLGWANGKTHYRPFLSKDGQVFATCGYGIARSKKNPGKFYACALFANRDPDAPAPAMAGGAGGGAPAAGPGGKAEKVLNIAAAVLALLDGAKPAAPGTAVGGMALKFAPGWKTVTKNGVITSVNPEGTARVIITPVNGPKDAADGPWDAIQADMARQLAPHFPGLADLNEVNTEHDVFRDGVGLRVVTYTATFQGKPVDIVVDFARENNVDGDRLVLIMRCSEQGDGKNQGAARKVAESLRLKK